MYIYCTQLVELFIVHFCNHKEFLGRTTYISADLHFTAILSSSSSFFFHRLISELDERNSTKIDHVLGSNCDLKRVSKIWGIPSTYKSGAQNHLFARLRNLTANLTAYRPIFGMKHDIDNRASVLTTTRGLLHCLKML